MKGEWESVTSLSSVFQWNIFWSSTTICLGRLCPGNIGDAVFCPWPAKHFLASFNFIMEAWTVVNSQIGTKPVWGPHPPLPLSTPPHPTSLPHPPITDHHLQSIRGTLPWWCFFYTRGDRFHNQMGWTLVRIPNNEKVRGGGKKQE